MYRLLVILCLLIFISCDESSTGNSEAGSTGHFDLIADSSYYGVSMVHNSHLPQELTSYEDTYRISLNLKVTLNEPSRREEIKKIIIYDDNELGWEFGRSELENFYSDSLGGYIFENLLVKHGTYETDKLFFIRLINDENQKSEEYNFILKGELPYSTTVRTHWLQTNELKLEYTVSPYYFNNNIGYYYQRRGYNPILLSNSAKINWLDENQNPILKTKNIIDSFTKTEDEFIFENVSSNVPESSTYFYSQFKLNKTNSEYELLTPVSSVALRIPDDTEFYPHDDDRLKLLYLNKDKIVFLVPNPEDQNYPYLRIYDRQTQEQIDEIQLEYDYYNDYQPVFVNGETEIIYYFSDFNTLYSYDLATDDKLELRTFFESSNRFHLFPFGNNIIVVINYSMHLYEVDENRLGANTNFNDVNSYYYSKNLDALFLGDEGERFYKVTYDYTNDLFNETEQLYTNNLSGFSPENQKIHFSAQDSVIIHTSGAVIDIHADTKFNADSAIVVYPFLSSPISAWLEQEQVLVVMENYSWLSAYRYSNAGFSKIGELNIPGIITDIFSNNGKIMVSSTYPDYSFQQQYTMVSGYTLDDFSVPVEEKRLFQKNYYTMKKIKP